MADIKIVRILGVADDIICKITKAGGKWQINDPLIIRCIPVETPQKNDSGIVTAETAQEPQNPRISFNIALAPFHMPYMRSDRPLECDACQVSYRIDPTDEVIEKYNSLFSPIIQPKFGVARQP